MQIIKSYSTAGSLSRTQQFRLFHIARPSVSLWRKTKFGSAFPLDNIDIWITNNITNKNITVVDFAGWYLQDFGFNTTCIESDIIAKQYYHDCLIESDIAEHRPAYISDSDPIILRHPASLKYKSVNDFVHFLNTWTKSLLVLNFNPRLILHNHLKFKLIDLVKQKTNLHIQEVLPIVWKVSTNG